MSIYRAVLNVIRTNFGVEKNHTIYQSKLFTSIHITTKTPLLLIAFFTCFINANPIQGNKADTDKHSKHHTMKEKINEVASEIKEETKHIAQAISNTISTKIISHKSDKTAVKSKTAIKIKNLSSESEQCANRKQNIFIRIIKNTSMALVPFASGCCTLYYTPFESHLPEHQLTYLAYTFSFLCIFILGELIYRYTPLHFIGSLIQTTAIICLCCTYFCYWYKVKTLKGTIRQYIPGLNLLS